MHFTTIRKVLIAGSPAARGFGALPLDARIQARLAVWGPKFLTGDPPVPWIRLARALFHSLRPASARDPLGFIFTPDIPPSPPSPRSFKGFGRPSKLLTSRCGVTLSSTRCTRDCGASSYHSGATHLSLLIGSQRPRSPTQTMSHPPHNPPPAPRRLHNKKSLGKGDYMAQQHTGLD